jgi:hypothetical protein
MATTIKVGTVFIQNQPLILRTLALESEPYAETWDVLQSPPNASLDRKIRDTGWSHCFVDAEVRATAHGKLSASSVHRALEQIFARVRNADFNCLEVTRIIENRFLGVPYVTVCAHSRHIPQGSMMDLA